MKPWPLGDVGLQLLREAVATWRAILGVQSLKEFPLQRGDTQINLAKGLFQLARRSQGEERTKFAAEARSILEATSSVFDQSNFPARNNEIAGLVKDVEQYLPLDS